MNKIFFGIIVASLVAVIGLEYHFQQEHTKVVTEAVAINHAYLALQAKVADEARENSRVQAEIDHLYAFTIKVMNLKPASKLSAAKRENLAHKIAVKVQSNVEGEAAQEQFVSMLKIEAAFDNTRSSSAGAIGLSQIMPGTFKQTLIDCDIDASADDIHNEDMNLEVGSCYFSLLLDENDNNPRLASLAYNGGAKVVEKFKKLGDVNQESSNYVLKVEYVRELANK